MRILFVCRGNICRSQMAEAIYNHLTKSRDASSAGTRAERAEMLTKYDLVTSMAGKHYTPTRLAIAPNYVYWKVTDPTGRSYAITKSAKEKLEQMIQELIHSTAQHQ